MGRELFLLPTIGFRRLPQVTVGYRSRGPKSEIPRSERAVTFAACLNRNVDGSERVKSRQAINAKARSREAAGLVLVNERLEVCVVVGVRVGKAGIEMGKANEELGQELAPNLAEDMGVGE